LENLTFPKKAKIKVHLKRSKTSLGGKTTRKKKQGSRQGVWGKQKNEKAGGEAERGTHKASQSHALTRGGTGAHGKRNDEQVGKTWKKIHMV